MKENEGIGLRWECGINEMEITLIKGEDHKGVGAQQGLLQ